MCHFWRISGLVLVLCLFGSLASAADLPLPRMVAPKTTAPPVIDGKLSPGEWDRAAGCTGFVKAFDGTFGSVQTAAWVTYDDRYFYVAMKNWRGPSYTFVSKRGRRPDDVQIVYDYANEIWFSPPTVPAETYQTLFNAYPAAFDVKMIPSVGSQLMSWSAHWEIASSETKDYWIVEGRAEIASFSKKPIKDGDLWRALFTTDVLGGAGFTAWAPGGGFADITRHGWLEFREQAPAFQLQDVDSVHTGKIAFPCVVSAPAKSDAEVTVTTRFGADVKAANGDLTMMKTVKVPAGKATAFTLDGDISDRKSGFCEITAKTAAGLLLYSQVFPYAVDGQVRQAPAALKTTPYDTPFGVQAIYAPLSRKLIVKIDRLYLPERAQAIKGVAKLVDPKTGNVVAQRPIAPFMYDLSEFPVDLAKLDVPVETEALWTQNQAVIAENQKLKAAGQPEKPLPFQPAQYKLEITLTDDAGKALATTVTDVNLKGYQFEWMPNQVGISDKVIPPWTPMAARGSQLSMWNKTYDMNGLGLAEKIINDGRPQLSGPMKMIAEVDGKATELRAPAKVTKSAEAFVELNGKAAFNSLDVSVDSRVEFDGCVLNTMTLTPKQPTRLDKLSLVVRMPKAEAPCFVTTAGGWSATHGWTPESWDSRETAIGSMKYNFVPYVLLTDSDRGFTLFVDSVRGWVLDEKEPTMQMKTVGNEIELRVNFVSRAGTLDAPTTLKYGWMVTPQKPQPKGWRSAVINFAKPYPQAKTVFYGMDQTNWAVLWPYYSSPYPWDYNKSKGAFDGARAQGISLCAGGIAHAIARYQDYKGRQFPELVTDWGIIPGNPGDGNVVLSKGTNDFRLWHWDQWMTKSGLNGLYFDENYLGEDWNYLTGGAFLLPDEQIHPGYNYLGLREMDKRLRYLFNQHGMADSLRLWLHTTSGQPVYAWMPDVAMEAENVELTSLENDYLDALPDSRLRSIGVGRNLGAAPVIMCQADRHYRADVGDTLCNQFVGWVLAHDCLPESVAFWPVLAAEMEMWQDDITFLPYWKSGQGMESKTKDVVVSAHKRPGHVVLWIVNEARKDQTATIALDMKKLGLDPAKTAVFDAETGERYTLKGGALTLAVPARMWRSVRLQQMNKLTGTQTFTAGFDNGELAADEAFGYRYAGEWERRKADAAGKTGAGVNLAQPLTFTCRQHVLRDAGAISCQLQADLTKQNGRLLTLGALSVEFNAGKVRALLNNKPLAEAAVPAGATAGWHAVSVAWQGNNLSVAIDGAPTLTAALPDGLPIRPMARGLEIANSRKYLQQQSLSLGPFAGAVLDDLVMQR